MAFTASPALATSPLSAKINDVVLPLATAPDETTKLIESPLVIWAPVVAFRVDWLKSVIVSLVAPYLDLREELKQRTNVCEFYIHTEKIRGREHFFSKDYQKPEHNFFPIDTTVKTVKESADEIFAIYRKMATLA